MLSELERPARPAPDFEPMLWGKVEPTLILERIKAAGIVGMGGAGYPTAAKLAAGLHYGTHRIVANGVECEPGVHADLQLLHDHAQDVIEGLYIVGQCLGCDQLALAVADPTLHQALLARSGDTIEHRLIPHKPANGEERVLINLLYGEVIPERHFPTQYGYVVLSVATLFAVAEAVRDGFRPTNRIATVFGVERWVTVGTPLKTLHRTTGPMRLGSVATGVVAKHDDSLQITTNAIEHDRAQSALGCIHCGWCDEVCPRSLPVEAMLRAVQTYTIPDAISSDFDACFECGACVDQCPSQIPLLDSIREGQRHFDTERLKQRAEVRFQRRNERQSHAQDQEESARAQRLQTQREW